MGRKTFLLVAWALILPSPVLHSADSSRTSKDPSPGQPKAAEETRYDQKLLRGPHHQLVEVPLAQTNAQGQVEQKISRFVRLAAGLHYWEENQWKESKERIEKDGQGAIARYGQHKVRFAPNLNTAGAIDLEMPDGKRLRSHVLGLSYYDAASGKSVFVAEAKNSIGEILPPNQIVYRDAFKGLIADVRYTWNKGQFEQDVILKERPPAPEDFGLDPATTRLEVLTEFLDPPAPEKEAKVLQAEKNAQKRAAMVEPDLIDETLRFGSMTMSRGKAFELAEDLPAGQKPGGVADVKNGPRDSKSIPVAKRWQKFEGNRDVLVEAVAFPSVKASLQKLPAGNTPKAEGKPQASVERKLPAARVAQIQKDHSEIQLAGQPYSPRGFVLDYVLVEEIENFSFNSGVTYFVEGCVLLYGSIVIQGGAVVKANYASYQPLYFFGQVICQASAGNKAVFTSMHDNAYGEIIPGSTGNPAANPSWGLYGVGDGSGSYLTGLRIRYAVIGVQFGGPTTGDNWLVGSTLEHCLTGVEAYNATVMLNDLTLCDVGTLYESYGESDVFVGSTTYSCNSGGGSSDDHGNNLSTATTVSPTSSINGNIETAGDEDYFRINVTSSGTLTAYTSGSTDTYGYLLDFSGNTLTYNDDNPGPNFRFSYSVSAGTYYVRVRHHSSSGTGAYTLVAEFGAAITDDHGNTTQAATSISANSSIVGVINYVGDEDYFRVVISSPGTLRAYTSGSTDTYGSLLLDASTTLISDDNAGNGDNFDWSYFVGSGTFYIRVRHATGGTGSYTLTVTIATVPLTTPTISPNGGSHTAPVTISLSTATSGATIYYTTDGTPPNTLAYSGPLTLSSSATVRAIAKKSGEPDSIEASANFTVAAASSPSLLNIDFAANPEYKQTGPAATGNSASDFWNKWWHPYEWDYTLDGLLWADQTSSGASVRVQNAPGQWGFDSTVPMYHGYIYPWDGGSISVTLSGLAPGNYELYLYGHAECTTCNSGFQVLTGNQSVGQNYVSQGTQATAVTGDWNAPPWVEGRQYVRFANLSVASTQNILILANPNAFDEAFLNGLQLRRLVPPDSDNDGLLDSWEMQHFGNLSQGANDDFDGDGLTNAQEFALGIIPSSPDSNGNGISDGYEDTDGDGWIAVDEYRIGTSPTAFNTPRAPILLSVTRSSASNPVQVHWEAASGPVFQYAVFAAGVNIGQVSGSTLSFTDDREGIPTDLSYWVVAIYPGGVSAPSQILIINEQPQLVLDAVVARGSQGRLYLVTRSVAPNAATIRLTRTALSSYYPPLDYNPVYVAPDGYFSTASLYTPAAGEETISLAVNSTGIYELSATFVPDFGSYRFRARSALSDGTAGPEQEITYAMGHQVHFTGFNKVPFLDGHAHLEQNLKFLLRAASSSEPFRYDITATWGGVPGSGSAWISSIPNSSYVVADYYFRDSSWTYLNEFGPFQDTYLYRNWTLGASDLDNQNYIDTGASFPDWRSRIPIFDQKYVFPVLQYVITRDPNLLTPVLPDAQAQLIFHENVRLAQGDSRVGVIVNGANVQMAASIQNIFGLPYISLRSFEVGGANPGLTLVPGGTYANNGAYNDVSAFQEVVVPTLVKVANDSYYFTRANDSTFSSVRGIFPGDTGFNVGTTSPLLIASVGKIFAVAGWEKMRIANGDPNKFAYLGQYFDKAFKAPNGSATSDETGVLSEYGEFFPTEPGRVVLKTKLDSSLNFGEATVYAIKMELDVNHDGTIDRTLGGPDNTSQARPFVFWVNDDKDNSFNPNDPYSTEAKGSTDSNDPYIKSPRDLEDFARLWISGLPSLPVNPGENWQVSCSWENGQGPAIRLYYAADHDATGVRDGGDRYLRDITAADEQLVGNGPVGIWSTARPGFSIGKIGPGESLNLPLGLFSNGQSQYFIFTAVAVGRGSLVLSVLKDGVLIGSTSVAMEIRDIRDMYERVATLGASDNPLASGVSTYAIQSIPESLANETKETIVFIHGYNMSQWEYENFSATMFKRLWWQGFQGRFASVKWETPSRDSITFDPGGINTGKAFNIGEFVAFRSGKGLANYLKAVRTRFPVHGIGVCTHSTGAQAMAEALRLLADEGQRPVDNYVMMQGALPAHSYDPAMNDPVLAGTQATRPTPNTYHNYAAGIGGGLNGNIVNFFNGNDWVLQTGTSLGGALETSLYVNHREAKPDNRDATVNVTGLPITRRTATPRDYRADANEGWEEIITGYFPGSIPIYGRGRTITNPHELMAFAARSRSRAAGAQAAVDGPLRPDLEEDLSPAGGVTQFTNERNAHSGEFNWNLHKTRLFYRRLMEKLGFEPTGQD